MNRPNQPTYAHSVRQNPWGMVILRPTFYKIMDYLRDHPSADKVWTLYLFYLKCTLYQNTHKIYATNRFAAKGLKWSVRTVRTYRQVLVELGLIEMVLVRDEKGQFLKKRFIDVKYWSYEQNTQGQGNRTSGGPALKMLRNQKKDKCLHERRSASLVCNERTFEMKCSKSLLNAIKKQNTMTRLPTIKTLAKELTHLQGTDHIERQRIKRVFKWFCEHPTDRYTPRVFRVKDIRDKFGKMEYARKRWYQRTKDAEGDDDILTTRTTILPDGTRRTELIYSEDFDT